VKKLTLIPLFLAAACQGTMTQGDGEGSAKQPAAAKSAKSEATAPAATAKAPPSSARYGREGFHVYERDGRLWVFLDSEKDVENFIKDGEPAKNVTRVGAGPDGKTLKGASLETLNKYDAAWRFGRPGFAVFADEDGRIWAFRSGSKGLKAYLEHGEPAKSVTMIGVGPDGRTVRGAEKDELKAYCAQWHYGQPGFEVYEDDGRLWVFRKGSEGLQQYVAKGEPAKFATRVGEGPDGMTVRGAELEALADYCAQYKYAQPGFVVYGHDGRLWVFREGSKEHKEFLAKGEPAKRVTLVGAGPDGRTVLGIDREVLDEYLRSGRQQ
jgi:hypothetical protein